MIFFLFRHTIFFQKLFIIIEQVKVALQAQQHSALIFILLVISLYMGVMVIFIQRVRESNADVVGDHSMTNAHA